MPRYEPDPSQRLDTGLTRTPDVEPGVGRHATNWNVSLTLPLGDSILLWVWEVEAGFELAGSTAQSRRVRQFFPHNFAQPTIALRGTVPNNYQYNRLASFVRVSQQEALDVSDSARWDHMKGHSPTGRRYSDGSSVTTTGLHLKGSKKTNGRGIDNGRTIRGNHVRWVCEGYIKSVEAGATRFEYAKDFELQYVISTSSKSGTTGLFQDTPVNGSRILPWMDVFRGSGPVSAQQEGGDIANSAIQTAQDIASQVSNTFS